MQYCEQQNSLGNLNWAFHVKQELNRLGLAYIWQEHLVTDIPFDIIKSRMIEQFKQQWYSRINNSNRLAAYARYKHDFNFEEYLDTIPSSKHRKVLTKFRVSSHDLNIETGRHFGIAGVERTCKLCTMGRVENEYHFLLACPFYKDLREKQLPRYYCHWPNLHKFDNLMSKQSKMSNLRLSQFLYQANMRRAAAMNAMQ